MELNFQNSQNPNSPSKSYLQNISLNINAESYISPKIYNKLKRPPSPLPSNTQSQNKIIEVYSDNFIKEIKRIGQYLKLYPFIGMDTEFPGVVYPCPNYTPDFYYQFTKANVDKLKLIQIGITLSNENGDYPPLNSTWQFNFQFDYEKDQNSINSISMLVNSGIDFKILKNKGIPYDLFAEYFLVSGLVLNENVTWISFNGLSDFCYMLRLLLNDNLPKNENEFLDCLKIYFPNIYDIKYLINENEEFKGGLNKIAKELNVERIGEMHQAGSDSIVTSDVFFKLFNKGIISKSELFDGKNVIFGVGKGADDNETITYVQFASGIDVGNISNFRQGKINQIYDVGNYYNFQ